MQHLRSAPPLLLAFVVASLAACEPAPTAPVNVMVMALSNTGAYEPRQVQLATVSNLVRLEGTAAHLIGGARLVDDPTELQRQAVTTDEQLRLAIVKNAGLDPRASYIERDGVFWPADFHSWNMATTYFNFEQAFRYFQENGFTSQETIDPATGFGPAVYYFPAFVLAQLSAQELRDNALFFPPVQAFAVLPFDQLQSIPLSMNSGIVTHEFAHFVFNRRVFGGASIPLPYSTAWIPGVGFASPGANIMRALDEGLADFHAFGASCNTAFGCTSRFLEPSLGDAATDLRDFRQPGKCMDVNLRNAVNTLGFGAFISQGLDYRLGTVISAALHRASGTGRLRTMQQALLAAYSNTDTRKLGLQQLVAANAETPANFTLGAVATSILQNITDPNLKADTCSAFMDYLSIPKEQMIAPAGAEVACPAESAPFSDCPDLP